MTPRVSILIPNYNNGRKSTKAGDQDLILDLLQSLHRTLVDDQTPFEVIAYDDGSTDDSLSTLRTWSEKKWPNGQPFLELIEAEHCGVLAKTANILSRKARGDILARLDGDVQCLTTNWVTELCKVFDDAPERLGVVGPKQLRPDGRIHAFGDWILHPHGYTHIGCGLERDAITETMEVDHVMGAFYCCRRAVFDDLEGYDEDFLRGQTVDFGLRARLKGWSCIAVPHIEYLHNRWLRTRRKTTADSDDGVSKSLDVFERKWGFNRIAPDLAEVAKRYRGTPLLWNTKWFAPLDAPPPRRPNNTQPLQIQTTAWGQYASDPVCREKVDLRVGATLHLINQCTKPTNTILLDATTGLIAHLLAIKGVPSTNIISDHATLAFAKQCTRDRQYNPSSPRFMFQEDRSVLPLEPAQADLILVFDQVERHPNPVGLMKQVKRALTPGGYMILISQPRTAANDPRTKHEHRYHWDQLVGQVQALAGWGLLLDPTRNNTHDDMLIIARKLPEPEASPFDSYQTPNNSRQSSDAQNQYSQVS